MASPTTLKKKYRAYSRCSPDRARWRHVQNLLPTNATVADTNVASVFAVSVSMCATSSMTL
jgi:hypothetical protein